MSNQPYVRNPYFVPTQLDLAIQLLQRTLYDLFAPPHAAFHPIPSQMCLYNPMGRDLDGIVLRIRKDGLVFHRSLHHPDDRSALWGEDDLFIRVPQSRPILDKETFFNEWCNAMAGAIHVTGNHIYPDRLGVDFRKEVGEIYTLLNQGLRVGEEVTVIWNPSYISIILPEDPKGPLNQRLQHQVVQLTFKGQDIRTST